jgi:NAD(P)-dependent dehydrogenase (short-subunit alcohol dehydrogenase family)
VGSGIGRELVLHLLSKGARVAGVDLNAKALDDTARLAGAHGTQFATFVTNISDRRAVEALPEQVLERFGSIDGIINNAGIIQPFVKVNDLDFSVIERVLNVNLYGTLFVIKSFLPLLLQRSASTHCQYFEHGRVCSGARADHLRSVKGCG